MKTISSKITAAILVVMMMFSIIPAMGLELSSQAAGKPTFSLNYVDETATQVVLTVKLDSGSFSALDFGVTYNATKVKKCTKIVGNTDIALEGVQQYYAPTGLYSAAIEPAYDKAGSVLATYTFDKVPGKYVTKDDFALKVSNCEDDGGVATAIVRNNLPTVPANETTKPTTTKPTTTEPTTTKPTTTKPTTTKPTTTKPTTTKPTTTKPTTTKPTTTKPTSTTATTTTTVPSSTASTTVTTMPVESKGKCGDNAEWFFDETTGTLIISGSGDMWDYSAVEPEWVTKHGIYIKEVTISYGITSIGAGSFKNCLNLETVYIPSSVVKIGAGAFDGCYNLKNVYYEGTEEDFRNLFPQAESIFGSSVNYNFASSVQVGGDQYEDMTAPEDNTPEDPSDKLKGDNTVLIIVIAAVVLLVIVACVLLFVKNKKKKAPAKEQEVKAEEEPFQYQDPNQFQYLDPFQQYQNQNKDQNDQK